MTTRSEMCDAILAAYRVQGMDAAYGMWLMAVEQDVIELVDLEIHARGSAVDVHAAQAIRDFDGFRRTCGQAGIQIRHPDEASEFLRSRLTAKERRVEFTAPQPQKEDDRATALLHAFMGLRR